MIIGLDKEYNVISIGKFNDPEAFSLKNVEQQDINIVMYNYKYENGKVIKLGLKREFTITDAERIKEELEELIEWELYRPDGKHNPELFILLSDYLNQGLFFNTIEEAEKAMDDYENAKQKEVNYNALSYLTNFISRNLIK